ncbi:hypothetical protein [Brevibacillus invocatus]|uniref:hypothetical protein n=1 Tax=Brevibacillus invocatus TaxID=173959 RepID=UPI00160682E3|nr:hypothetical protein [Brevibacillus invocatus]
MLKTFANFFFLLSPAFGLVQQTAALDAVSFFSRSRAVNPQGGQPKKLERFLLFPAITTVGST